MAEIGDNSAGAVDGAGPVNVGHLRAFIERVERMNEEIKALNQDKADIFGEAKANGFDVKVLKDIIKIRAQDRDTRIEHQTILEVYLSALGMS